MFHQDNYVQHVRLSTNGNTLIKFAENLEFTCLKIDRYQPVPSNVLYKIVNVKGNLEITKISDNSVHGSESENQYDKYRNEFVSSSLSNSTSFYITAKIELKEMYAVTYQLRISSARLQCLEFYHFFKEEFVLPGFHEVLTYYVKKVKEGSENDIEIHIINPRDVKIQGKKGDSKIQQSSAKDVDLLLSFAFYPGIFIKKPVYSAY